MLRLRRFSMEQSRIPCHLVSYYFLSAFSSALLMDRDTRLGRQRDTAALARVRLSNPNALARRLADSRMPLSNMASVASFLHAPGAGATVADLWGRRRSGYDARSRPLAQVQASHVV